MIVAAVLTWILPAGQYDRQLDAATHRDVVVPGTFHAVEPQPVGPLATLAAVPRGIIDAADVIALVFLVGGAFVVVDRTGALRAGLAALVRALRGRHALVIPLVASAFALGGITENMQEEIIALVPVLLLLARRTGFDAMTVVAMSLGAAMVGSAFSPMNPFQVLIAQKLAQVPLYSGWPFRTIFLITALAIWIAGTMHYAARVQADAAAAGNARAQPGDLQSDQGGLGATRTAFIGIIVIAAFALFIFGLARLGWGFIEMSAIFFIMGVLAGLVGRLGWNGTAQAYTDGFRDMAYAALLIGFARAIYVVLSDGLIVDTIVHGLFQPLEEWPRSAAALGMMGVQALIHIPVPSVSGQAVLTLPILVPLSDLLGITRQITILAYQFGAGLSDILTPTNGALMAILAAAGVRYDAWLKFAVPLWAALMVLATIAIVVALAIGLA
jgi:uncharacterized ion transporter superfamily protein YfcC